MFRKKCLFCNNKNLNDIINLGSHPLADTFRAFIIRAYKKQSPFVADRVHLHHRLIDKKGLNHWQATLTILFISISVLVLGFLLSSVLSLSLVVLCLLVYMIGVFFLIFK